MSTAGIAELLGLLEADATVNEGTLPDGTRWWRETGEEEAGGGKLCRWTVIRGVSADGSVEWEERTWRTSDAFGYRELGAEKSGRGADGAAWREAWKELYTTEERTGLGIIVRSADKWARAADGSQWQERWHEDYKQDGRTDRTAHKWGKVADGVIPEDGHAARWTERWGESWNGLGAMMKWTDKWYERDEREGGGAPRKWGEKWDERFGHDGGGGGCRTGEAWSDDGGAWYSRHWGEEHFGNGWVRKYGHSTTGEHWDTTVPMDTWYERFANSPWESTYRKSPELLAVPLRSKADGAGGGGLGASGLSF